MAPEASTLSKPAMDSHEDIPEKNPDTSPDIEKGSANSTDLTVAAASPRMD